MTNPNNAVGTNAAYSGRTSVNAFNDGISAYSRGIMSGWACVPNTGLKVSLGGSGNVRDVAIAEDNSGNKTTINNISGSPIDVTLASAPASNSRIDSIVVYVDNPPTGSSSTADNPAACGIIAVKGIVASSPTAPTDNEIRSAITADGASGVTAYYAVLANITIPNGTTDITSSEITAGAAAAIGSQNLDFATIFAYSKINDSITYSSESTMATIEIPLSGKYMLQATVGGIGSNDSSDSASQWRIKKGGSLLATNVFNHVVRSFIPRYSGSIATIADCTTGDTIQLTAEIFGTGTASARDGQYFIATRIS